MMPNEECAICLDMGTTRTRAWLVSDGEIQARCAEDFGVRDSAIAGTPHGIMTRLGAMVAGMTQREGLRESVGAPTYLAAAGMIGSPSALMNVPHVPAPAGIEDLSAGTQVIQNPLISALPLYLVPGVRTAAEGAGIEDIEAGDVMRGEEALCAGLLQSGTLQPNDAVLNLGSHWKWILIGSEGKIAKSRTSLTGELIHAVQANTLLASAVPQHKPAELAAEWLEHGARAARQEGLTRALFCVRLLEQGGAGSPDDRLSYLYGAVLETEISAVLKSGFAGEVRRVMIAGSAPLASAWADRMRAVGWDAATLSEAEVEQAYLHGLLTIVGASPAFKARRSG